MPTVFYTYTPSGGVVNHYFIWRVPESSDVDASIGENQWVMDEIIGTPALLLQDIYIDLTGDASVARASDESEVDKRLHKVLESEHCNITVDLREG